MSDFNSLNFDQVQNCDFVCDGNFEIDDLVAFQHDSKKINIFYSQLTKYSKRIRDSYLFSDVKNRFPQEIHQFQEEFQLLPDSIDLFFQLLHQNYNIKEDLSLTYIQCVDLLKISKFLIIRKLFCKINQYIKSHNVDVDFIIQMIQYDNKTQAGTENQRIKVSEEIENLLASKINECISNEKFKELPIEIIYRAVDQSSPDAISSNKLFDLIVKSLSKFCILFQFLDLQKLSDDRIEELYEMHSKSNENTIHYFDYLKCNLDFLNEINNRKKNLEKMNDEQRNELTDLKASFQKQLKKSEKANDQLQNQLKNLEALLQNQLKDLRTLFQKQFNEQLQNQVNHSKNLESQIIQLQNKLDNSEGKLKRLLRIEGRIVATAENGFINAEIDLNCSSFDATKSKFIVSTSDAECIGSEAYEKGEAITSNHMKTRIACNFGKYYVRCIIFNSEGESKEIVSNSVTTILTFVYEGKESKISLPEGRYKLKVSGAKGGDSTGNGESNYNRKNYTVEGGLGGYSTGILRLNKQEIVYVRVGEKGRPSNSSDGSTTEGGFPDGGGTQTGHRGSSTTVPGTGGGSTSIRIGSDTDYTRVIVAGGGGGASGDSFNISPGGFGGGLSGGNCYYLGELYSQGAGTQIGSTRGCGYTDGQHGDPGKFGLGATGKYCHGRDSGGGGGGGWYGGGSGGYGSNWECSSGGGGSGWAFTESSMAALRAGDSANSSNFALTSEYYLTDVMCAGGNEEFPRPDGNGKERGHSGNGYAKITPL